MELLRWVGRSLTIVLAGLAGLAGAALGAQVSTRTECVGGNKGCSIVTTAIYSAAPGEANDLRVERDGSRFTFRDVVAVGAGLGCEQRSPSEVSCIADLGTAMLGDGADSAAASLPADAYGTLRIDGGDGPDRLRGDGELGGGAGDDDLSGRSAQGGPGRDRLVGTSATDALAGGADQDELYGLDGDDGLLGDGLNADGSRPPVAGDLLDGGPGSDGVTYIGHAAGVRVEIGAPTGGAEGEHDRFVDIESAIGGDGDDILIGDDRPNVLHGGFDRSSGPLGGDDQLFGKGGDDRLDGGAGNDLLDGGADADTLRAGGQDDLVRGGDGNDSLTGGFGHDRYDGGEGDDELLPSELSSGGDGPETATCGGGADIVRAPHLVLVEPDCELVGLQALSPFRPYPAAAPGSRLVLKFSCPKPRACSGSLRLRLPGEPKRYFARVPWSSRTGRVRVAVTIPDRVRRRPGDSLHLVGHLTGGQRSKRSAGDIELGGFWVFDLRRVAGFQ